MANSSPAVVNEITGRAWIRNSDGSLTELHQGSKVPAGSDVVTASGATVSLQVENGMPIVIGEGREVAVNGDMTGPLADPTEAAVAPPSGTDSDRLLAALQAGRDPFDEMDPTAAVVAGGGEAGGSSFVRLARILETTSPLDLAYPNPARADDTLPRVSGAGLTGDNGDDAAVTPTIGNNAPNALNDASSGDQNSAIRGNLLSNDVDPDGDPLAIVSINGRPMVPGGISVPGSTGGAFVVQPDGSYVFTPGGQYDYLAVGETATSTISYTITDPSGATSTATVVVTITGTNDGPVSSALTDQSGVDAQTEIRYDVSDRFSDPDTSDTLTFNATGLPPGLSIDPNTGIITGTIDHSASQGGNNGVYTVIVTATDPSGVSTSQEFQWDVSNPAPTAVADSGTTDEDTSLNVNAQDGVLANDTDPDGDTLTVSQVNGQPGNVGAAVTGSNGGTFTLNADGSYTFNPGSAFQSLGANQTATTSITYTVSDGEGGTSTATLTVTVTGTNDAPILTPEVQLDDQAGNDGQAITPVDVSGQFSDVDTGDALTYSATGLPPGLTIDPATGIISGTLDKSASQGGADGVYTVTVTATDKAGASVSQDFSWDVKNPAPTAVNDSGDTDEDTTLNVNAQNGVLANDTDPDGDTLHVSAVNGQATNVGTAVAGVGGGTFTLNADGSYTFNPGSDFQNLGDKQTATSTITYTVSDGEGGTSTATLTVTITGTNDTPILTPGVTLEDQSSNDGQAITPVDVSGQFSDVDTGDALTYSATGLPPGLTINAATGVISGTLDKSASQGGTDGVYTITVTATDKSGASVSQDFSWDVKNPAPTAVNDSGDTDEDTSLNVNAQNGVLANDTDPDGDALHVSQVNNQAGNVGAAVAGSHGGTFTLNADGSYTFNPGSDFQSLAKGEKTTSSITYTVSDGEGGTSTATLTVEITGTNDAPTAVALDNQSNMDGDPVSYNIAGFFSDVDNGDVLSYTVDYLPGGITFDGKTGTFSGTFTNWVSDHTNTGVKGEYLITVTATDKSGATVTQSFVWKVGNPEPIAADDTGATGQDNVLVVDHRTEGVLGNDKDPDGDPLHVSHVNGNAAGVGTIVAGSDGGTFILNADGTYSFNPGTAFQHLGANQQATTSITYTVSDFQGATSTATLTITITGTNDTPILTPGVTLEDQSSNDGQAITPVDVSGQFTDVDSGDVLTYSATGLPPGLAIDPATGVISGTLDKSASQGGTDGVYTITVTATDKAGTSVSQDFSWDVKNPAPTAVKDSGATDEDTSLNVNAQNGVLANDTDPDGDALHVSAVNGQATNVGTAVAGVGGGTFTLNADGSYTFNPGSDFQNLGDKQTATSTITYTVSDGEGGTSTATLTVTITGTNDTPILTPGVTLEDQSSNDGQAITPVDVSGQFTDVDSGDVLTYSATGLPPGLAIDPATGVISGTLDKSASQGGTDGVYTITVTATDKAGTSVSQDFSWDVKNPAPTAVKDSGATDEDTSLNVNAQNGVLANDTDPDGDALHVSAVNGQATNVGTAVAGVGGGTFTLNADGSYTFNPGSDFQNLGDKQTATSTITYTVSDGEGGTSTATLTVTITGTNDTPILTPGVTLEDQTSNDGQAITPVDVSGQFSDVDSGDVLTYSATGLPPGLAIDPATGVISGTLDKSASQGGTDGVYTITVTATDKAGTSVSQDFSWDVKNPAPTAVKDSGATDEDTSLNVNAQNGVLANDTDPDGDALHVSAVNGQATNVGTAVAGVGGGTFTLNADGSYTFNPGSDFQKLAVNEKATSSITYTVSDGEGGTSTATLTVTITGANDAPTITSATLNLSEEGLPHGLPDDNGTIDTTNAITYSGKLTIADTDVNDTHTVTLVKPAANALSSQGKPVVWALSQDGHTLVGNDHQGNPVITVTMTDTGAYTVTLSGQVDHPLNSVEDVLQLGIGVQVSDGHTTSNGTISINIEDDSPDFGAVANTTMANAPSTATGTLEFHTGADAVGATLLVSSIGKLPQGWTTSALNKPSVDIFSPDGTKMFTVTLNPEGGYTVTQHEARPGTTESIDLASTISNSPKSSYDLGYATLSASGGQKFNANTFGTGNSFGIGNTSFDSGESFRMDFKQALSDFKLNVAEVKGAGTLEVTVWSGNLSKTISVAVDRTTGAIHISKEMLSQGEPSFSQFDSIQLTAGNGIKMSFLTTGSYTESVPAGPMEFTVGVTGTDGDGDKVSTHFDVTSTAEAAVTNATNSVAEATGATVSGSMQISAALGIVSVAVNGVDVTKATNANPVNLTTDKGTLKITGYDPVTGKLAYTYTENGKSHDHSNGKDSVHDDFTVTVKNADGHGSSGSLTIQITDTAPVAKDDSASVTEDTTAPITGNVLANDTLSADKSTVAITTGDAKYGKLVDNGDGTWSYQLNNGLPVVQALNNGQTLTETIRYTITDADGDKSEAVLTITIKGQTDAPPVVTPVDSDGNVTSAHNSVVEGSGATVTGSVGVSAEAGITAVTLAGRDVTGASAAHPVVITTDKGVLTVTGYNAATGVISYSYKETGGADDHSAGDDSVRDRFTVTVTDLAGKSTSNDLIIQIIDTAPVAENDSASVTEDTTTPITGNVLTNDTLGADKSTVAITTGDAKYGKLVDNGDGTWSYQLNNGLPAVQALNNGQTLTETIRYTITDADGDKSEAVLTITINGTNDAPVLQAHTKEILEDQTATGNVLVGATDVDSKTLVVTEFTVNGVRYDAGKTATIAGIGTIVISANGSYTFTPDANWNGDVPQVKYTVSDGAASTSSTLDIDVLPVNDAPVSQDGSGNVTEGKTYTFGSGDFVFSDPVEGHAIKSVIIDSLPTGGTLLLNGKAVTQGQEISAADIQAGKLVFQAASSNVGENAGSSFDFRVKDSGGTANGGQDTSAQQTFKLHVDQFVGGNNTNDTIKGGSGNDVLLGDQGGMLKNVTPGTSYNIALVLDLSGSMDDKWGSGASRESRLDTAKKALKALLEGQLATHDGTINVSLITFEGDGSKVQKTISGLTTGNVSDMVDILMGLKSGGGTPYGSAFNQAKSWFDGQPTVDSSGNAYKNLTFFLTDGEPTSEWWYNRDTEFGKLAGVSEVHGIGIGSGVSTSTLNSYDNTGGRYSSGGSVYVNFSGNSGANNPDSWQKEGTGTATKVSNAMRLTDTAVDGKAYTVTMATANKIVVTNSGGASFGFDATVGNKGSGDTFKWILMKWNGSEWKEVESGSEANTRTAGIYGPGEYLYKFILNDNSNGSGQFRVDIDNIRTYTSGRTDNSQVVLSPSDLETALVGGSTSTELAPVGNDKIFGGDGSDILFGDAINTDSLPWGVNGNPAKPADLAEGSGLDGLKQFLLLKNGVQPTDADLHKFISDNHGLFDVQSDTRGGNDELHGGSGNDILYGQGGDDFLYGDDGNDILYGGTGKDTLHGGAGNDILIGGKGDDILIGGEGSDTFKWEFGDQGTTAAPAVDVIKDFSTASVANGGDVLDLQDMLQGEKDGTLSQYLHFSKDPANSANTVIEISTNGKISQGADQKIILENVDLTNGGKLGTDQAIINDLLQKGKLNVDHN